MFTISDICNIAIQIERNGEKTYRAASKRTDNAQLAKVLQWMADEEERHAQWFKALDAESKTLTGRREEIETMGRSLLQEMMKGQTFSLDDGRLLATRDILDLLSQSVDFERDTILFYEMLQSFIDDEETLVHLNNVIAEERGHVVQLQRLQSSYQGRGGIDSVHP